MKSITALILASLLPSWAAELKIDTLPLRTLSSGWGKPQSGKSISGGPLKVGGTNYEHGVGTHAPSTFLLTLDGSATRFKAKVGVDDYAAADRASVEFKLIGDGRELWTSGLLKGGKPATPCDVDLTGIRSLQLAVTDGGNGTDSWRTVAI